MGDVDNDLIYEDLNKAFGTSAVVGSLTMDDMKRAFGMSTVGSLTMDDMKRAFGMSTVGSSQLTLLISNWETFKKYIELADLDVGEVELGVI